ncbi:MAG: biliverdin-producing heme oxygenase [Pseudomonadota bacterium]
MPHQSLRTKLAAATQAEHEALHHHRWIVRLMAPDLSEGEYRAVLSSYQSFYGAVEAARRRTGHFADLSLSDALAAMEADLSGQKPAPMAPIDHLRAPSKPSLLGALYVLHGAAFGAGLIGAHIRGTLPHMRCAYFSRRPSAPLWRRLVAAVEDSGAGFDALTDSARRTFLRFGAEVTRQCEQDEFV